MDTSFDLTARQRELRTRSRGFAQGTDAGRDGAGPAARSVVGGTAEQQNRLLAPFLATAGAPLAAFCSTELGGSANAASPPPGEGARTRAVRDGDDWVVNGRKKWVSSATG